MKVSSVFGHPEELPPLGLTPDHCCPQSGSDAPSLLSFGYLPATG